MLIVTLLHYRLMVLHFLRPNLGDHWLWGSAFLLRVFLLWESGHLGQVVVTQLLFYSLFFNENQFTLLFIFNVSLSSLMNFTVKLTKPWTLEIFQEWPITADIRMCEFSTNSQTNLSFFACSLVFACLIIKIFFLTTNAPEIFLVSAGLLVWQ